MSNERRTVTKWFGRIGLALGSLLVLLVVACGTTRTDEEIETAAEAVAPGYTTIPGAPLAPDFELPDLDGRTWSLAQFRGQPVMLFFWATW